MTTWAVGDYPRMAERLEPAAHRVVEAAGIERPTCARCRYRDRQRGTPGRRTGGRGCRNLFRTYIAGHRLQAVLVRGPGVRWVNADVGDLPVLYESASAVLSVFGVMYAADDEVATREFARAVIPPAVLSWHRGCLAASCRPWVRPFRRTYRHPRPALVHRADGETQIPWGNSGPAMACA